MMNYRNLCVALCLVSCTSIAMAAEPEAVVPAKPATSPATVTPDAPAAETPAPAAQAADEAAANNVQNKPGQSDLQATIRQVKGIVQYRTGDDQPWQKVEVGQVLDVGVEFRTGPRSEVTFHLPPDQLITLDRLGTLKLLDALNNDDKTRATTELGMRYGRTRYEVEGSGGVEHHATIRSPNATLAIRGTQTVTLTDEGPGRASASTRNTRVYFRAKGSPTEIVFGSNGDDEEQVVDSNDTSPAGHRFFARLVDPSDWRARSRAEFRIINDYELYNGPGLTNQGIRSIANTSAAEPSSDPDGNCCDPALD